MSISVKDIILVAFGINNNSAQKKKQIEQKLTAPKSPYGMIGKINRFVFNMKARTDFYIYLASQLKNGADFTLSLKKYRERRMARKRRTEAGIMSDMIRRLSASGTDYSQAMKPWIPHQEYAILYGYEKAGQLAKAFKIINAENKKKAAFMKLIRSGIGKPVMSALVIYATLLFIGIDITPSFSKYLAHPTGSVAILYAEADYVDSYQAFIPPLIFCIYAVWVRYSLPGWRGKFRVMAEKFPPYSIYKQYQGYMWLVGFLSQSRTGTPEKDILDDQIKQANPWLAERLKKIRFYINQGNLLPVALKMADTGGVKFDFPNIDLIEALESVYGKQGAHEAMDEILNDWQEAFSEEWKKKIFQFSAICMMIVYCLITFVILALNDLSGQLANGIGN